MAAIEHRFRHPRQTTELSFRLNAQTQQMEAKERHHPARDKICRSNDDQLLYKGVVELRANQHSDAKDLTGQAHGYEYYEVSK